MTDLIERLQAARRKTVAVSATVRAVGANKTTLDRMANTCADAAAEIERQAARIAELTAERDEARAGCAQMEKAWEGNQDLLAAAEARSVELETKMIGVVAALSAAVSLLERSPKTAAPSDKMFDQMLEDYTRALATARTALNPGDPK